VRPEPERRLAAVLAADVAGYSRLMATDEDATVRALGELREEVGRLLPEHRGRLVDFTGDNFLTEFPTALDAVRCAVAIQQLLGERNAGLPDARRMQLRIGVHLGDIRVEGERIYGDGVNIAARLEGLSEAGGIAVSDAVRGQVRSKLDLGWEDLGEQSVKNLPEPVRVFRARFGAGAEASPATDPSLPGLEELTVPGFGGRPAVAVLPFDNLSPDPEQEYFADGVAEDLITRLSCWRSLPVIARNSSFTYKGKAVDVKQVSRELGVRYVVEGSVRKAGRRVRVSAQLIDAPSGHHLWAETYDRELEDLFELQDEITTAIVAAINPELQRAEMERAVRKPPQSLDAYEHSMRGFWHFSRHSKGDNTTARSHFEKALEVDPGRAAALMGLVLTHSEELVQGWTNAPLASIAELERLEQRCSALDPRDPNCQRALAFIYAHTGRREQLMAACKLALELNPSDADAYGQLGYFQSLTGQPEEAIANLEKALRLNPRGELPWLYISGMAWAHMAAARYHDAVECLKRCLQWRPDYNLVYRGLAASYAQLGRLEEARAMAAECRRLEPDVSISKIELEISFADPAFIGPYFAALREAGIPE
jgi:adenylate cyclase